ncbi:MAG: hypothetical protein ABFD92_21430 [Planctomycetaceae bacterium]
MTQLCQYTPDDSNLWRCTVCGHQHPEPCPRAPVRTCRGEPPTCKPQASGPEVLRRLALCEACPQHQPYRMGRYCKLLDHGCEGKAAAKFSQRILDERATCRKWT